jgi:hypothetical protein
MAFDINKFIKTTFESRTCDVPVPDLKAFFAADEPPVFKVRGLTGNELARVHDAVDKHKNILGILESLVSTKSSDKVDAIRKALGVTDDVPNEIAKRLEMLIVATVSPQLDLDVAVKLAENFPIEFYSLTGKITELTGQGAIPLGKPQPSGPTPESKQP